jgi:hypothetical protein
MISGGEARNAMALSLGCARDTVCALFLMTAVVGLAQTHPTNLALSTNGGSVERITSEAGSGLTGNRLIDGNLDTTWQAPGPQAPQEVVLSFFNRQSALLSGVRLITSTARDRAPSRVEVWISPDREGGTFSRVAAAVLKDARQQELTFTPVNATYVKLVILETFGGAPAEIAEIEALEGSRSGYKALAVRNPAMRDWAQSPRYAAQRGVDWLSAAAIDWQRRQRCFGCHVQGQVVPGLAIAKRNGYRVSDEALTGLISFTRSVQKPDGSFHTEAFVTATQFAVLGMAHGDDLLKTRTPELVKAVDYLLSRQAPDGEIPIDHHEPPIDQGSLMTTTNASIGF